MNISGKYDADRDAIVVTLSAQLFKGLSGRTFHIDDVIMPNPEGGSMSLPVNPKIGDRAAQVIVTEMESLGEFDG
jgi:hypothetical protein